MKGLTTRQREVLERIEASIRERGFPPSVREIAAQMGLASAAGVHKHIKALVRKGYLSKADYLSRSLRPIRSGEAPRTAEVVPLAAELAELPLAGYVAAGRPIEAVAQQETLPVPASLLRPGREYFVLRVRGDSMIEESILDGDYVVMERREDAADGEVVVALLNGAEATLKRLYRQNGSVRLQPANATMAPIVVDSGEVRVQGVVAAVWRRY